MEKITADGSSYLFFSARITFCIPLNYKVWLIEHNAIKTKQIRYLIRFLYKFMLF